MSFNPSYEQIAQALASEYLKDTQVSRIRFGKTNEDDSAVILGQFGFQGEQPLSETAIPGPVRRALDSPEIHMIAGTIPGHWSPDGKYCGVALRDKGVVQGHSVFEFDYGVPDEEKECVLNRVHDYCMLVSLYISLHRDRPTTTATTVDAASYPSNSRVGALTSRQIDVLRGMVEGHTNTQIARRLGYSHSTIKQEAMKIFQALSVGDRSAAAKRATNLNLV